jgi:DNA-binding XRE family transcriptional regulator
MITGRQIRAARALLEWDAEDLATKAELSRDTIFNIENGKVQARGSSADKIVRAFNKNGLEFTDNSGVRLKPSGLETYEGDMANRTLLNDVYNTLRDTGGEVLISHVDEAMATESVSQEFLDKHLERLEKANIKERMLVRKGDSNMITETIAYRAIPEKYFVPTALFIYGDKLGLASWSGSKRSVIIHDALFAESARKLFNFVWDHAESLENPSKTKGKK